MIFTRLLALGILTHEVFALCSDGKYYLTLCFLPTFGLTLKPPIRCALHLGLMTVCVLMIFWPQVSVLYFALLLLLSLVIASYYLRLSNHLIVAWTMTLLLLIDLLFQTGSTWKATPTAFLLGGVQLIIALTYFLSFLHKLNREYFSKEMSCGASLARLYLKDRRIGFEWFTEVFSFVAIYGTLALEAALPFMLLAPRTRVIGLLLAAAFQMQMGFLCHFHFSSLMYAGLAAFVPLEVWPKLALLVGAISWYWLVMFVIAGMLFGLRFGISSIHRYRGAAALMQMYFGVYTLTAFAVCLLLFKLTPLPKFHWEQIGTGGIIALGVVCTLFLLNGLGPYLGIKTEFSLAMFSNLRPEPWRHVLFLDRWRPFNLARYITVEEIDGLPERGQHAGGWATELVLINLGQREQLKYSSYFFHEGLKNICRSTDPPPVIRVVYTENGQRHEVNDYAQDRKVWNQRYLRANLFPFRLPKDDSVPYCS